MSEEKENIAAFLDLKGWENASVHAIAGDMSTRRYMRVQSEDGTAVLMVAQENQSKFIGMTEWLRALGLSAPEIMASNASEDMLLLEDFGDVSFGDLIKQHPADIERLLFELVDVLLTVRSGAPPNLPDAAPSELIDWTRLADAHYPGINSEGLQQFREVLLEELSFAATFEQSTSLRDFHSQNVQWLAGRRGAQRFGLLDYQDAFLTHPAYDLMSLMTDARFPFFPNQRDAVIDHYVERSGDNLDDFKHASFALSAQRNLRVLGIFARAKMHLDCLPVTYRYLSEALESAAFSDIRSDVLSAIPAPDGAPA